MNETWSDIHNEIRATKNPEEVLTLLDRVDEYNEDTRRRVLSSGLDRLWNFEYFDFESVLLTQCAKRSGYEGHIVHVLLGRWLKGNPHKRDDVMRRLLSELDNPDTLHVKNILWTFMSIGYRSEALEDKLLAFVTAPCDDQTNHLALWSLTVLGYADHTLLEKTLQKVIEEADVIPELIMYCGRHLASLKLLPYFEKHLLRTRFSPAEEGFINLLYILSETSQAHPEVASAVWDTIFQYERTWEDGAKVLDSVLRIMSDITRGVDDERVADFFLYRLEPDDPSNYREWSRVSSHYHWYLRLSDLEQPKQLAAMSTSLSRVDASTRDRIIECLHQDATVNTLNPSAWQTQLTKLKECSWNIVLQVNISEAKQWIVEALEESDPFAASNICSLAGYLRVIEAISKLHQWIILEDWGNDRERHISLGLSAVDALGNIGTPEAFQALTESQVSLAKMRPDLSVPDTTPLRYCEAFAACILTMQDAEQLVACLEEGPAAKPRCWVACAFALQQVIFTKPALVSPYRERVFALLCREDMLEADSYYLHYLLPALGGFDKDEKTEALLLNLAGGSERNAVEAMEVLARWGTLHLHHDLLNKLGLESAEQAAWKVTRTLTDREAFILGLLFGNHPEEFTSAVYDLIEKGSYREVIQAFAQLSAENASPAILDALSRRAHRINTPFQAETEALWTLRRVAPERFVKEFPFGVAFNWPATAREAVVKAYRGLEAAEAADTLAQFLTDDVYNIRRIAARTLAEIDLPRLHVEAKRLLDSENVHERGCGIEAAAWLPDEAVFQALYKQARHDREANVRSAANETVKERRRVLLARQYLQYVLETPADQLTSTWQYGQALQQLGDDETLRHLHKAASEVGRPPNQRAYLKHLHEQVEKGWEAWQKKRNDRLEE